MTAAIRAATFFAEGTAHPKLWEWLNYPKRRIEKLRARKAKPKGRLRVREIKKLELYKNLMNKKAEIPT